MKTKTLPHFPFYPTDFIAKTTRLTDEELGSYMRLLCEQWIAGDLPSVIAHDGTHVPKVLRMISESIDTSWNAISKYFIVDGGIMKNPRLEKERVKAIDIYTKRVKAGKKSAEVRLTHAPTSVPPTQNSELITKNIEPKAHKKRVRFTPPTLEEATEYFISKDSSKSEAENFIDFYSSKGWMVGKNKMTLWKAAASRWIKSNKSESTGYRSELE